MNIQTSKQLWRFIWNPSDLLVKKSPRTAEEDLKEIERMDKAGEIDTRNSFGDK